MVFFLMLFLEAAFNAYLIDLYTSEGGLDKIPRRLIAGLVIAGIGAALTGDQVALTNIRISKWR